MKNLFAKIASWFKKPQVKEAAHNAIASTPIKVKKPGRGAYFHNNRKRTRGRNTQYVLMPNGRTRVIRHETI